MYPPLGKIGDGDDLGYRAGGEGPDRYEQNRRILVTLETKLAKDLACNVP